MRVGTFVPTYWPDYGTTTVREAVEEAALAAEALGFASVWANDHVIAPLRDAGVGHIIELLMTLASLIHLTLRNPHRDRHRCIGRRVGQSWGRGFGWPGCRGGVVVLVGVSEGADGSP
jgi:hypothetical protein